MAAVIGSTNARLMRAIALNQAPNYVVSASCNRRTKHICILPIVIMELQLRNVERRIWARLRIAYPQYSAQACMMERRFSNAVRRL
jgi:hypothetical protein